MMHAENSIVMKAPAKRIFDVAADLARWPEILPHYRWVKYLQRTPEKNIVKMAARRNWIPVKWTSELEIDPEKMEVRFRHLKAFTKGMQVVWTFETQDDNTVQVRIRHDLQSSIPILGNLIAENIIGKFFIHHVANQTLTHMKKYVESTHES